MKDKGQRMNWKQACWYLRCGKNYFYSMVNSGQLSAWRVVGKKRGLWVWEKDLKAIIKKVDIENRDY